MEENLINAIQMQNSVDQPCSQASISSGNEDATEDLELSSSSSETTKRHRLGDESLERFEKLCGTIDSVPHSAKLETPQFRNTAFLQMLDEYLQRSRRKCRFGIKLSY